MITQARQAYKLVLPSLLLGLLFAWLLLGLFPQLLWLLQPPAESLILNPVTHQFYKKEKLLQNEEPEAEEDFIPVDAGQSPGTVWTMQTFKLGLGMHGRVLLSRRLPKGPPLDFHLSSSTGLPEDQRPMEDRSREWSRASLPRADEQTSDWRPNDASHQTYNVTSPRGLNAIGFQDSRFPDPKSDEQQSTQKWPQDKVHKNVTQRFEKTNLQLRHLGSNNALTEWPRETGSQISQRLEARQRPGAYNRQRRHAQHSSLHHIPLSVCDSKSYWVVNKVEAADIKGENVSVLRKIRIEGSTLRQYFYETKCQQSQGAGGIGCRGIDRVNWFSECRTSQSYVQALTRKNGRNLGLRWIRIDTACVCALNTPRKPELEFANRKLS
uniref:Nerve growth factor-related domain-containing protein n=1 Tax=Eptatretus burgeri TaxID=7764 RepID=A0A8C4QN75_EPTBU